MKERLTGAIILVAFLVLLVPELLTGPSRSATGARATDQESGDARLRSYTIDLSEDSAPRPAVPSSAVLATPPSGSAEPGEPSTEQGSSAREPVAGGAAGTPAEPTARPESAASSGPAGPAERARPAGSARPAGEDGVGKPATAREPTAAPAAPVRPPESGWVVQVGSFASHANANRLARQLKDKGFAAFVRETSSNGRRLYRVRIGPQAERDEANAVRERLRKAGYRGSAVIAYP